MAPPQRCLPIATTGVGGWGDDGVVGVGGDGFVGVVFGGMGLGARSASGDTWPAARGCPGGWCCCERQLNRLRLDIYLVEEVGPVEGVALFGDEARIADDTAEILFRRLELGAGLGNHVLLNHHGADVVAAETEADLAHL